MDHNFKQSDEGVQEDQDQQKDEKTSGLLEKYSNSEQPTYHNYR